MRCEPRDTEATHNTRYPKQQRRHPAANQDCDSDGTAKPKQSTRDVHYKPQVSLWWCLGAREGSAGGTHKFGHARLKGTSPTRRNENNSGETTSPWARRCRLCRSTPALVVLQKLPTGSLASLFLEHRLPIIMALTRASSAQPITRLHRIHNCHESGQWWTNLLASHTRKTDL